MTQQDKEDPFAIPNGLEIGDEYKVPFGHPKEGNIEITIHILQEYEGGPPIRFVNVSHAALLTKKSRETAGKIIKGVKRHDFSFVGNAKLVRYDDVREAIAAAHRPKAEK